MRSRSGSIVGAFASLAALLAATACGGAPAAAPVESGSTAEASHALIVSSPVTADALVATGDWTAS